jgi:hypothetical protein
MTAAPRSLELAVRNRSLATHLLLLQKKYRY